MMKALFKIGLIIIAIVLISKYDTAQSEARAQLAEQGIEINEANFRAACENNDLETVQLFISAGFGFKQLYSSLGDDPAETFLSQLPPEIVAQLSRADPRMNTWIRETLLPHAQNQLTKLLGDG